MQYTTSKSTISWLILLLFLAYPGLYGNSKQLYGTAQVDRIISVYDGDTFRADLKDLPAIVGKNIGVRIYGIDTPEIRGTKITVKAIGL